MIATLELHGHKELLILRKLLQDRMDQLRTNVDTMHYKREDTIEYLTLGQIHLRLPEPALLTPDVCTEADIQQ